MIDVEKTMVDQDVILVDAKWHIGQIELSDSEIGCATGAKSATTCIRDLEVSKTIICAFATSSDDKQ